MRQAALAGHLQGRVVVITRPAGTAASLVRQVGAAGGTPLRLPGLSLRAVDDAATRLALGRALSAARVIFTSPAAVRHAARLRTLAMPGMAIGVGQGTCDALRRAGVTWPLAPARQDSEGVLALPVLQDLAGCRVALIGATGGRGLLREVLAARGAVLEEVHVYRRVPPRLDRRHVDAVRTLVPADRVLWSSIEAIANVQAQLPADAWRRLCEATAVVSSERVRAAAEHAGFGRWVVARSARPADLLAAAAIV
jgi:uroporphyrinogen-III synthase